MVASREYKEGTGSWWYQVVDAETEDPISEVPKLVSEDWLFKIKPLELGPWMDLIWLDFPLLWTGHVVVSLCYTAYRCSKHGRIYSTKVAGFQGTSSSRRNFAPVDSEILPCAMTALLGRYRHRRLFKAHASVTYPRTTPSSPHLVMHRVNFSAANSVLFRAAASRLCQSGGVWRWRWARGW